MRCPACNQGFEGEPRNCPYCGEPVKTRPLAMLKTSTILISSDDTEGVYRSVREVPEPLRKKLLRLTSGLNARTILIADQRGQQEITRALHSIPEDYQAKRLSGASTAPSRFSVAHAAGILLAGVTGVLAWLLLFRR